MVGYCANPACSRPLHYLREGRIFIFDIVDASSGSSGRSQHHLDHYWLCGECSRTLVLRQRGRGIEVMPKPPAAPWEPCDAIAS